MPFTVWLLVFEQVARADGPVFAVPRPDPRVRFTDGRVSLLVSQIGYALPGVRVAYLTAQDREGGDAIASFEVVDGRGRTVLAAEPAYAGCWQGADFWSLDLSSLEREGSYRILAGDLVSQLFRVTSPRGLWLDADRATMMTHQLAARRRPDAHGGFADCGNDFRETHAHAAVLVGIVDALELDEGGIDEPTRREAEAHVDTLAAFLLDVQDEDGRIRPGWDAFGRPLEDGRWPNHLAAATALVRLALHRQGARPLESMLVLERARRALEEARQGIDLESAATGTLAPLLRLEGEWLRGSGEREALKRARAIARELRARQIAGLKAEDAPPGAPFRGLFRTHRGGKELARLNEHGAGEGTGALHALDLEGLAILLELHPQDEDAELWRATLRDYVEQFLEPAAARSPLGLVPNGVYGPAAGAGDRVRWFSDLYHGMSGTYAHVAASLVRLAPLLADPALLDLAEKQLLWVGGLNTGSGFPQAPEPFSCLAGRGYRSLLDGHGPWSRVPGSIVNGLSATPAFDRRMPEGPEAPAHLSDESWIAHTGPWLSATARLVQAREMSQLP